MPATPSRIGIVGLGLIGGSIAAGLKSREASPVILAFDQNADSLEVGVNQGLIDDVATSIADLGQRCELVIICVPVLAAGEVLQELKEADCLITDVGSVKQPLIQAARSAFGHVPDTLVPGHPIAGSERHGVGSANPDLFVDHKVILTPAENSSEGAILAVTSLWAHLGAEVIRMTPEHHDDVLAQTSHLPHLLAYALVDTLSGQGDSFEIFQYAAGGFRDFSRIAASDPVMWRDIFRSNQQPVLKILDRYVEDLAEIRTLIEQGDMAALEALFARAKAARDHFAELDKK